MQFIFDAANENDTDRLGSALANVLPGGATVALTGTLGAGKTRLVQAIAQACGVDRQNVLSPTFVLVQEYDGCRYLCHIDAYRLQSEEEFLSLGCEEFFELPGNGLTLIEWADRVERCLPNERLMVNIIVTGEDTRRYEIIPIGDKYIPVVKELQRILCNFHTNVD